MDVIGEDRLRVRLSDNGNGLRETKSSTDSGSGTGMKLIDGLAKQIGAEADWSSGECGTELRLEFDAR